MITIAITGEAYAAIMGTLPEGAQVTPARRGEGGGFCITLDLQTINRLTELREAGECYSDVILRLAKASVSIPVVGGRGG
jgi:hypothetical protein